MGEHIRRDTDGENTFGVAREMGRSARPFSEWLRIAGELKASYDREWPKVAQDNRVTTMEGIALSIEALEILERHGVTIRELLEILKTAGPALAFITASTTARVR